MVCKETNLVFRLHKKDIIGQMINEIDWELDTQIIKKKLLFSLAKFFVKRGEKFVDENFYYIHVFVKSFIESKLVDNIKQVRSNYLIQNEANKIKTTFTKLDDCFNHIGYSKCFASTGAPNSIMPSVIRFIRADGDIISAFELYLEIYRRTTPLGQVIIDAPEFNLQLLSDKLYYKEDPSHIDLRIFKNTSLENLANFIERYKSTIQQYQQQGRLVVYPHKKKGRSSFEYFKVLVAEQEKQKKKLIKRSKNRKDITLNTDNDMAAKVYGDDYYDLDKAKDGANRLRVNKHRILSKLKD